MNFKGDQELEVWQKSVDLVVQCYQTTKQFPKRETFGLASQFQRAGVSVPANIAEGRARQHSGEFLRHLSIAHGSLAELETHIFIADRLDYLNEFQSDELLGKASKISWMINGLRRSLEKKLNIRISKY